MVEYDKMQAIVSEINDFIFKNRIWNGQCHWPGQSHSDPATQVDG